MPRVKIQQQVVLETGQDASQGVANVQPSKTMAANSHLDMKTNTIIQGFLRWAYASDFSSHGSALAGIRTRILGACAGACALALTVVSVQSATLTYDFNNGLQGWTQIGTTTRAAWNSGGNAWGATQAGSIYGYDGDDGADATYWVRSPAFQLDGSGPLTVRFWGGKANAAQPANEAAVPANSIAGGGFKGVVLRDVATGDYVRSLSQTTDGANGDYSLSVADLAAYANDGKQYTLDYLDYDHGGWGWVGLDNVTIPGRLMQATLEVTDPAIVIGSNSTVVIGIPLNLNATVAVTVYLTNSNPTVATVNGSADSTVPVTFAIGAPTSQNVTVVGTGLGYVRLTTGGAGLESARGGFTVLSPSGLIGRWLTGPQDLLDKSGYMPAGTHDGTLSGGQPPFFADGDVPPGATGASLDLASTGGAVLIANSSTSDGSYQPTFDDGTAHQLSVVFWAKYDPTEWNPFVSKWGEGSTGWQVRKRGNQPIATFTLRGTGGEDDPYNGWTLINDLDWHHFAATWDGATGVRKLYVDGKLNNMVPHDFGPMGLANVNSLTLGGRSGAGSSDPGNTFAGHLFDVQVYGVALTGSAVQSLFSMNSDAIVAYPDTPAIDLGREGTVSVSIPATANATLPVTVFITNTTPTVVSLAGAAGNVVTLTFPAGGATSQTLALTGLSEGQAQLECAASGLNAASVTVPVYGPQLIGRWFNGAEDYTDSSGFAPAGTHDGSEVGAVGTLTFTTDTPPSKPGKAAQFGGAVGLQVGNSSRFDASYAPTFDDVIARQFSVAFWAKGLPAQWSPFLSKRGEDNIGWQARRQGSSVNGCFTIRGTPGADDPQGAIAIDDGKWHHFAAVWDGYAGTRKWYVDGLLDPSINLTGDFGPLMMAANHHLVLGAREQGQVTSLGFDGWFNGALYDVRMYNYPLNATEVKDLAFVAAVRLSPAKRSLQATETMTVDVILPEGANQSQQVVIQLMNETPTLISLVGAVGNAVTLTFPVSGSLTQQVSVVGITDGKAGLSATGGGFPAASASFNVWSDPGERMIGRWFSGEPNLTETSGFRPAGVHDGVAVGANAASLWFSTDVPVVAPPGAESLDLSIGNVAVMITNSATTDGEYLETFDYQMANKFSIAFWAKGTFSANWNPWVSKRGENGLGYQVRRYSDSNPTRPTFTIRGTTGSDDPDSGKQVDNDTWHHYAATWDGNTGVRMLYLDGNPILSLGSDFGPMALATGDHLVIGGRDSGTFGNFFPGLLYDVRVYSYALDSLEIGLIANPPAALSLALAATEIPLGRRVELVISLPVGATASTPVTVYLTNNSPSVVTIVGPTAITFPVGSLTQVVELEAIGAGQIDITAGAAGIGSAAIMTVNTVVQPKLIGHWLAGATDLADKSGHTPAGTHDGVAVGANAGSLAFSSDVPAGFTGQSLNLTAGNVGVVIQNTANTDAGYLTTFDDEIAPNFTIAFWAKGFPGSWAPWVSKRGEGGIGWQLRRWGGNNFACFTIRGLDNDDGTGSGINVNDSPAQWRHFAGVWDQASGTRVLYVDGVLSHVNYNTLGQIMSLAADKHLVLGARHGAGADYEAYFSGHLFDVRVYDYALAGDEVAALLTGVAIPSLAIQHWSGNQVRISWPASFTGYVIEQSTALITGWDTSGLSITVEGEENVAYVPTTATPLFLRLKK